MRCVRAGLLRVRRCSAAYRAHLARLRPHLRFFFLDLCIGTREGHLPSLLGYLPGRACLLSMSPPGESLMFP